MRLPRCIIKPGITLDFRNWYGLPILINVAAFGLIIVALAYNAARKELPIANLLFWIGLLLIFVPIAARLISEGGSRQERIGLIVILGCTLYMVRVLNSPRSFTNFDEFLHWRTLIDSLETRYLFSENPLHLVGSLYPGLVSLTSALITLTGLDVFIAGTIIVGVTRFIFMIVLYLLYEEISKSEYVASIAVLLYIGNPQFVFFDAMFAYESLALPLGLLAFVAIIQRFGTQHRRNVGLIILYLVSIAGMIITHHITSYMLMIFLILWIIIAILFRRKQVLDTIITPALLLFVMSGTWLIYIAELTIGYISGNLISVLRELVALIFNDATMRNLFNNIGGYTIPIGEQMTSYAAVALTAIGILFGIIHFWRKQYNNSVDMAFVVVSLAYPIFLLFRFTNHIATVSRVLAYAYIPIAYVIAFGIIKLFSSYIGDRSKVLAITTWVTIIFLGGVIIGWAPWGRLPGPYIVSADSRSIEPEGVTAAKWARKFLGNNNRIATDRINGVLMLVYGMQYPITKFNYGINISEVFMSPEFSRTDQLLLEQGKIQYIIIDNRLTTAIPPAGVYFELSEPDARKHINPIDPAALRKFDAIVNVDKIFDGGNIVIYNVKALSDEQ